MQNINYILVIACRGVYRIFSVGQTLLWKSYFDQKSTKYIRFQRGAVAGSQLSISYLAFLEDRAPTIFLEDPH